jgi:hypothetical protein
VKHIEYSDLRKYGINTLTGEACPYGMRVLCDLTEQGRRIVLDMLGCDLGPLPRNWNGGSEFSMMIPRCLLQEDLLVWCLMTDRCDEVLISSMGIVGREPCDTDEEWDGRVAFDREHAKNVRLISRTGGPSRGTRMTHSMSGRAV